MPTRSRTRLTREGWYYLFVLAFVLGGAILREINLLLIFGGMLLGPLLMSWWMTWRSLRNVKIERHLPQSIGAGDLVVVGLNLTNKSRRAVVRSVSVDDSIERLAPGGLDTSIPARALFAEVPPGESRRTNYRGQLPRGRYRLGPLRLTTRFPIGLVERTIEIDQPEEIIVLPRLGRLTGRGHTVRQEAWLGNRRAHHRQGSLEADFYGLRDWRAGDSSRWIHWRTSARRGGLMVRQFEQPRHEDLVVLLELWQPQAPDLQHLENVEVALSYAATVLSDACRWGNCRLLLGIAGREAVVRHGVASRSLLEEAMEALTVAEASDSAWVGSVVGRALRQVGASSNVLVIGTRQVELSPVTRDRWPASRMSVVNVAAAEFAEVFQVSSLADYSPPPDPPVASAIP